MIITMNTPFDACEVARQVQKAPDSVHWSQRKALAADLGRRMKEEGPFPEGIALLRRLAGDPKWEVRAEVAHHLLFLPEKDFSELAATLGDDCSGYVLRAVKQAVQRRRKADKEAQQKRRSLAHIQRQYTRLERCHGSELADQARDMAQRLCAVLVGATVHDMRSMVTPLESSIVSLQHKLKMHSLEQVDLLTHLPRMRRQVESLHRMLDDMKTYSQAPKDERRRENVAMVVEDAIAVARDALQAAGRLPEEVRLKTDLIRGLTFHVARDHVVRAVANVIKNAHEAFAVSRMRYRSGTIRVTTRAVDEEWLDIVVQDDGVGLSEADLADVRRFVPGGMSKVGFGTGFGLPTARRMIEAHGGSLDLDSQPGRGTKVTITLPRATMGGVR